MDHKMAFLKALQQHGETLQKMATGGTTLGGPTVTTQGTSPQMGGISVSDANHYGPAVGAVAGGFNFLNDLTQNHFQGSGAKLQPGTNAAQLNQAYDQSQTGIGAQQNFLNALQAQNGIQNQSNSYNQMQDLAAGRGPNPAQAMLNNATGSNIASQAALMAGQRGAGANPGLMAREAAMQGAGIQENAAGQAAALQAQQSLNAMNNASQIAQNQVNQQGQATQGLNTATQNEQNILQGANSAFNNANVGMQSNLNNVNAMISQGNQQAGNALTGGIIKGISSVFGGGGGGLFADGGEVGQANVGAGNYTSPQAEGSPQIGAPGQSANMGDWMSGGKGGGSSGGGADLSGIIKKAGMAAMAEGGEIENPNGPKSMTARQLNGTAAPKQQQQQMPQPPRPENQGATLEGLLGLNEGGAAQLYETLKKGGKVPGQPKHPGKNTEANDTVPALLTPKEVVLPLTVTQSKNAPEAAKQFMIELAKKNKMACGGSVQKMADGGEANGTPSDDELRSRIQGIGDTIGSAINTGKDVLFGRGVPALYEAPAPQAAPAVAEAPQAPVAQEAAPTNVSLGETAQPQTTANPLGGAANPNLKYDPLQGLNTQMSGVKQEAKTIGQLESEKAKLFEDHQLAENALQRQGIEMAKGHDLEVKNMIDDMKNGHIDPSAYMNRMSGGQKLSTAIGLILGGIGGGIDRSGQNPAMDFLNKQIQNDLTAQIENRNNKNTIFNAMEKQYGNKKDALNMTHAFLIAKQMNDISQAAAKFGTPLAMARRDQALGPLQQEYNNKILETGMRSAAMSGTVQDPTLLVKYLVPKEHQAEAFKEMKSAEDTAALSPKIIDAFHRGASRNPVTSRQGQREFEGLINTTVQDLEGSVKQAAIDSIHKNMTPSGVTAMPGENEARLRTVIEYLGSKSSAPISKGYGIDLAKFRKTAPPTGGGFKKRN